MSLPLGARRWPDAALVFVPVSTRDPITEDGHDNTRRFFPCTSRHPIAPAAAGLETAACAAGCQGGTRVVQPRDDPGDFANGDEPPVHGEWRAPASRSGGVG